MNHALIARRLAIAWAQEVTDSRPMCIEATRCGIEALRRLGVKAQPLPCEILVANRYAYDLVCRGVPVSQWPPWAHSVGVAPGLTPARPLRRGWSGHLVIEGDDFIADFSLAAFTRPQRGLIVGPWAWAKDHDIRLIGDRWVAVGVDIAIQIKPRPELAGWRTGSAWRRTPNNALVHRLVARSHLDLAGLTTAAGGS